MIVLNIFIKQLLSLSAIKPQDQKDTVVQRLEHTERELSQQLRQAREALATRTQELDSLKAEWTTRTSDITSQHAQLITEEKEKALQVGTLLLFSHSPEKSLLYLIVGSKWFQTTTVDNSPLVGRPP